MRVVTFNILHGRSLRDGRVDVGRFAAAVRALDPDVLALQEVDRAQARSGHADLTAVAAEAMAAVAHRFVPTLTGTPGGSWVAATGAEAPDSTAYGVALLSRYPARSWRVIQLTGFARRVPFPVPGSRRLSLVADEPRVAVVADLDTPLGALTVASTHLSFVPGWNLVQLHRLGRALARANPLLLTGDLNLGPAVAARTSGLTAVTPGATFPADRPVRQIDHVLRRGLPPPYRTATRHAPLSDHLAVLAQW